MEQSTPAAPITIVGVSPLTMTLSADTNDTSSMMRVTLREAHLLQRLRSLREYCIVQVFHNKAGQPIAMAIDGKFEQL